MTAPNILETIAARRLLDVAAAKARVPAAGLKARIAESPPAIDFAARLRSAAPMAVMAEIKRASPSKGDIAPCVDAGAQALVYAKAGAAAVSVLTEPTWFKGSLEDLGAARSAVDPIPDRPAILRKDFLLEEYQLLEARAGGADAVLLIVAILSDADLQALLARSRELGMEPLVEVNSEAEMGRALAAGAMVIGINNRDLRDFSVDLDTTVRLAGQVPANVILAALSGISTKADVGRFRRAGASAVLVGEALMRAADPASLIRELAGA
jgi:anthranilate synthase/indole-3-glycerol phosphate synthase/phosphoribosylanthranilate isomerase